jgi:hypothetical protein
MGASRLPKPDCHGFALNVGHFRLVLQGRRLPSLPAKLARRPHEFPTNYGVAVELPNVVGYRMGLASIGNVL